jgi:hypothetical protein
MPPFSYLRSDYPLNLTLLEHAHACPSTWFHIAGLTPRTILTSPLRHNCPLPISFYQRYSTNSCSFACVPLARKSPFGLTFARASLHRVPASYRRAFDDSHRPSICKSTQPALQASSLFRKSVACAVVGSPFCQRGTEGVQSVVSPLCRAVREHRSKSSQKGGTHDVSK